MRLPSRGAIPKAFGLEAATRRRQSCDVASMPGFGKQTQFAGPIVENEANFGRSVVVASLALQAPVGSGIMPGLRFGRKKASACARLD